MKFKTIFIVLLLFLSGLTESCVGSKVQKTPSTVEEAEKILAAKQKKQAKANKKAQKEAHKRYWNAQTPEARKSIKKNKKRQKRIARHQKKKRK